MKLFEYFTIKFEKTELSGSPELGLMDTNARIFFNKMVKINLSKYAEVLYFINFCMFTA